GEPADLKTRELIEMVLDSERPDLVALTGDTLGGKNIDDPALAFREVVKPIEKRRIPWAAVFGNHDDEARLSRLELLEVQRSHAFCLSERGPEQLTGVGNYVLCVAGAREPSLSAALYFLDSNSYSDLGGGQYAWIARDQQAYYLEQSRKLQAEYAAGRPDRAAKGRLPALAFFHIPLPEYDQVWDFEVCRGFKYERVCAPKLNSGFFAALVEAGDVMGCFVGHDHVNDYEGELCGIRLCYGRGTGDACYGRKGFQRGARIIRLREGERGFSTWLRLADGTAITDPVVHQPAGRVLSPE
ncbi:MAG TPA: metallophosphoesterase family protein, partial [Polyangiaceae bacterium]|nr:metallophosphoesterase family protein [Polyangiaceae bacterium]